MQDKRLIELHSHLLPQLDDGSDSVEMSVAMLHREAEQGIGTVCATSNRLRYFTLLRPTEQYRSVLCPAGFSL